MLYIGESSISRNRYFTLVMMRPDPGAWLDPEMELA